VPFALQTQSHFNENDIDSFIKMDDMVIVHDAYTDEDWAMKMLLNKANDEIND
jgi:hypothetical protein